MWVGGCVTAPVAWASGPSARSRERPWVRRSVHRSAKIASRRNQAHTQSAPFGEARTQNAPFRDVEVASPAQNALFRDVEVASPAQNALFRRVRFSSPAQTWSHLTQRRILRRRPHVKAQSAQSPHGKAHSARPLACRVRLLVRSSRKMRFSVASPAQNALFRDVARPECAFP